MKYLKLFLLSPLMLILVVGYGQSNSWNSWRGPRADGSTSETNWSVDHIRNGNAVLWTKNVGTGHSAVAVNGDKLFTMGNWEIAENKFIDRVVCLDAHTGKLVWKYEYSMAENEDPGPFSTPVWDEGHLYTLGRGGQLFCFNASDGSLIWNKNLVTEKLTLAEGEFACSPLIVNDLLVLNMNTSGLALNKQTGDVVWNSAPDKRSLSTAVPFSLHGKTFVATEGEGITYAIDPTDGQVQWTVPEGYTADPVFYQDQMLIYSYKGSSLYNLETNPPERIWNNLNIKASFQSYVRKDAYSYGFNNRGMMKLICFDIRTGNIQWEEKMSAGSLIISGHTLIIIDKEGVLRFVEASPTAFKEIATASLIHMAETDTKGRGYRRISGCWTNPVLCNKKLYIRNTYGELVCLNMAS